MTKRNLGEAVMETLVHTRARSATMPMAPDMRYGHCVWRRTDVGSPSLDAVGRADANSSGTVAQAIVAFLFPLRPVAPTVATFIGVNRLLGQD